MDKGNDSCRLTRRQVEAAERILRDNDRVELVRTRDGVKVVRIRRTNAE